LVVVAADEDLCVGVVVRLLNDLHDGDTLVRRLPNISSIAIAMWFAAFPAEKT